ncbi:hypothetical protein [[Mycobacterium] kokjensenii]|uniref:hypothetical protein n=1 Tax=[Mycobacterium] kokjensenii TaxID=3064287 RepID=UPI0035A0DCFD
MTIAPTLRAGIELVLAVAAGIGAAVNWSAVRYPVLVAPVVDGEPETTSICYHAPALLLVWLLATAAGVLAVVGVARLCRPRPSARHAPRH